MTLLTPIRSLYRFIYEVIGQFFQNRCPQRAAGLAYSTLLAIVPLFTVLVGFGGNLIKSDTVKDFLAETLLPTSQKTIMNAIGDFSDNSSHFGALGLLIFLITVVILLNNIEIHLSIIFRIRTEKTLLMRFSTYTAVLVLSGLLIGASITLSGNLFNYLLETYGQGQISSGFVRQISSFLFIFLTLLLLILLMPSGKIRINSALLGAGCASILWEIAKKLFSAWANASVRISVIYGSLFLIPLLLIWLYVVWIIILLSVEVTYVHQHRIFVYFNDTATRYPGSQLRDGIRLYSAITTSFSHREDPPQLHDLSMKLNLPELEIESLLDPFLDNKLIHRVRLTAKQDGYVPAVPPEKQALEEIIRILFYGRKMRLDSEKLQKEDRILKILEESLEEILGDMTTGEILEKND